MRIRDPYEGPKIVQISVGSTIIGTAEVDNLGEFRSVNLDSVGARLFQRMFNDPEEMGISGMPNVFENNEPHPDDAEDHKAAGDDPHILLPPLQEGHAYSIEELPSGRPVVKVIQTQPKVPRNPDICNCSKYQSCDKCRFYKTEENANTPESRTLRHRD